MKHPHAVDVPTPEFSRRVAAEEVATEGEAHEIFARPEEREALARRFDLLALNEFSARLRLRPLRRGLVRVEGQISAAVEQSCVVTLEPVARRIEESFAVLYGPTSSGSAGARHEVVVVPEDDGPPEPIEDGAIDLGEVAAQQLALAIDPYPRAPNASLGSLAAEIGGVEPDRKTPPNPFAVLTALKDRR